MAAGQKTASGKLKKDASTLRVRKLNGKVVQNALYCGPHGKYFAASIGGQLVEENGVPVHFKHCGELVAA